MRVLTVSDLKARIAAEFPGLNDRAGLPVRVHFVGLNSQAEFADVGATSRALLNGNN